MEITKIISIGDIELDIENIINEALSKSDIVIVVVPAYLTTDKKADLSIIKDVAGDVGQGLKEGALVLFETTLPVGTTRNIIGPILSKRSKKEISKDFHVAFSPERVSSGSALRDLTTYPKIIGGVDSVAGEKASSFYSDVLGVNAILLPSSEAAELAKLMELTFRDVNIALANEFALCAQRVGVDVTKAIEAANSQPYSNIHQPGIGVGGHCVPVNPWFFINGIGPAPLSELAREINDGMASEATRLLEESLGPLDGKRILILGLAYRGNVKEAYCSTTFLLVSALSAAGADVLVNDPLFTDEEISSYGLTSAPLGTIAGDIAAVVLQADHDGYKDIDWRSFQNCKIILDGRNALSRESIEQIGIQYIGIGI